MCACVCVRVCVLSLMLPEYFNAGIWSLFELG